MAEAKAAGAQARAPDGRREQGQAKAARRAGGPSAGLPLFSFRILAGVAAVSAATLAAELVLPAAIWAAALHLAVVFLGVWLAKPRDVVLLGLLASLLLVAGALLRLPAEALLSAAGLLAAVTQGAELANRLLVLLGVWAVVAVLAGARWREATLAARLLRETARRRASESALERRHSLPRPAALPARIRDDKDLGHEVRTHLNAILGFSDAAKQEIFGPHGDPRYRDYLGHINEAGWALLKVLDRTLAADPLPDTKSEPGARRTPGALAGPETAEAEETSEASGVPPAKAVNQ